MFPSPRAGYLRASNFRARVWLHATKKVGLKGFRFHDLRHTAATLAVAAGASTKELMGRLGHSTPAAALRYQHAMEGRDAAIAAAPDQLVQAAEADPKRCKGTGRARGKRGRKNGTDG